MARLIAATLAIVLVGLFAPAPARAVEWQSETVLPAGGDAHAPSVAFGPDGSIHIAFIRGPLAGASSKGFYYLTNASGAWVERKLANASLNGDDSTSIAVDRTGAAHVVFHRINDGIYYVTNRGGAWKTKVFAYTTFFNVYPRIAVDRNGKAHIAYFRTGPAGIRYVTNKSGAWKTKRLTTNAFEQRLDVAVDSRAKVHIIHSRIGFGYRYITNAGGWHAWRLNVKLTGRLSLPSVTINPADRPTVALSIHDEPGLTGLWTGSQTSSGWPLEHYANVAGATEVAVAADGSFHVGMDASSHVSNESGSWQNGGPGGSGIRNNANGPAFALSRDPAMLVVVFTGMDGSLIVHTRGAWDGWSSP
jgi:hypothetical protein